MKMISCVACGAFLLALAGCSARDAGPTQASSEQVDAGKAETVRAEIRMGAGTLRVDGGASNLLSADFRYSESVGKPAVHYDVTDSVGHLTVESPKSSTTTGNVVNEWTLKLGSGTPLDLTLALGAGESHLDVSRIALRSLKVSMGAGEMSLNMAGRYTRDVAVEVAGGVGEAQIKLPRDTGAVVEVHGGIGSVTADGLTQRDGKYYNDAYAQDKPAVRMSVRGGVGDVKLSLASATQAN